MVYYLVVAVFLPSSETAIFSKAFERVRNDPQVSSLMGLDLSQMKRLIGENMRAYGENSRSRWARNRRIAYRPRWIVLMTVRFIVLIHRM